MITPAELKKQIRANGQTILEYSLEKGLSYEVVTQLLSGRVKGNFGAAHDAAVKMNLKEGVLRESTAK